MAGRKSRRRGEGEIERREEGMNQEGGTQMEKRMIGLGKLRAGLDAVICRLDALPLWWSGLLLAGAVFLPYLLLGEKSVFPIHDQLDETILTYVLNARHLTAPVKEFPELLGGIPVSGFQPSAVLFIPLYALLPAFAAFVIQYLIVFLSGFFGMYLCARELTGSNILAAVAAGAFSMLPLPPVYGLSAAGVPLLLWCFLCLNKQKNIAASFILILFFGLSTHLVLIGYVVLGFWALALLRQLLCRRKNKWLWLGFCWLTVIYVAVNKDLFVELVLGQSSYVSHREELVNGALPFWDTVKEVFLNSAQHADSCHRALILPILAILLGGGILYRKMGADARKRYKTALAGMGVLAGTAVLYGLCKWQPVVDFKNGCRGFLHYFQLERFYWLYPAGWYLEFVLCCSLWWGHRHRAAKLLALGLLLFPALQSLKMNSYLYMSVNQMNNGSGVTGYITWESYYAEELMQELEEAIGRDKASYRVAHLGMSPAPALMHGFFTADGYSNNYPLEYKHRFRRVIERELEKSPETAGYFDTWGSRCYLFNAATGNVWMLGKGQRIVYENLELDLQALGELGCEYIFSCGEIMGAEELGLQPMGYFETDESYWGVWLYGL